MTESKRFFQLVRAVLVLMMLFSFSSACSRQKAPMVSEKKPKTFEITPTVLPATGMVQSVRLTDTNSAPHRPPRPSASTPESKKAMRERQTAFARDLAGRMLVVKQDELALSRKELIRAEHALRAERDVAAALAEIHVAESNLENECVRRVDGFQKLLQEKVLLEEKLGTYPPEAERTNAADAVVMAETAKSLAALISGIGDRRRQAAIEIPEVAEAYRVLVEKGTAYQQVLAGKESYRTAREKTDALNLEIADLTKKQEN